MKPVREAIGAHVVTGSMSAFTMQVALVGQIERNSALACTAALTLPRSTVR